MTKKISYNASRNTQKLTEFIEGEEEDDKTTKSDNSNN